MHPSSLTLSSQCTEATLPWPTLRITQVDSRISAHDKRMVEMCDSHPMFQFLFDSSGSLLAANGRGLQNLNGEPSTAPLLLHSSHPSLLHAACAALPTSPATRHAGMLNLHNCTQPPAVQPTQPTCPCPCPAEHLAGRELTLQNYLAMGQCDGKSAEEVYAEASHSIFVAKEPCYRVPQLRWSKRVAGKYRWVLHEMWPMTDPVSGQAAVLVTEQNISQVRSLPSDCSLQPAARSVTSHV